MQQRFPFLLCHKLSFSGAFRKRVSATDETTVETEATNATKTAPKVIAATTVPTQLIKQGGKAPMLSPLRLVNRHITLKRNTDKFVSFCVCVRLLPFLDNVKYLGIGLFSQNLVTGSRHLLPSVAKQNIFSFVSFNPPVFQNSHRDAKHKR